MTREIGIRVALGATRRRVLAQILGDSARLLALGLTLGLVAALALTRLMSSLLFRVGPTDPVTLATVTGVLAAVGILAAYLPARRATRIAPATALRND